MQPVPVAPGALSHLTTDALRTHLSPFFNAQMCGDVRAVYQFLVGEEAAFHLVVADGAFEAVPGAHPEPTLRYFFDDLDGAFGLLDGRRDPTAEFMAGRIRTDGNLILALRLTLMFRPT